MVISPASIPIQSPNGDKFKATIMCEGGMTGCDIYFRLQYRTGTGPVQTLGEWHEAFDGMWYRAEVDLSPLMVKMSSLF